MPHDFRYTALVSLAVLFAALRMAGADLAPPAAVCTAVRTGNAPVLDGQLQEPFWQAAPAYGDFTVFQGEGRRVQDTSFRVAYDDAWLYLGVDCRTPNLSALQPIVTGHDKGACRDDAIELFLDPGTAGKMYFHYMLSFANARDEKRCMGNDRDVLWDVPWRSATCVREDGWSAELAIPLYVLASCGRTEEFRLNVARTRRVPKIDTQKVVVEEQRELSVWSPVLRGFHEPERFVPLAGITVTKLQVPLLARITGARVLPYAARDGKNFYTLDFELRGDNDNRGELELRVVDQPAVGTPREQAQAVTVAGTVPQRLTVDVQVDSLCSRAALLQLCAPGSREVLDTFVVEDLSALNVMTAFLDRNYYTTEACAVAVCRIGLPAEALPGMTLEARAADGTVLGKRAGLATEARVEIPPATLPLGASKIDVVLRDKGGVEFFKVALDLMKRSPKPGVEWKIDRARRVVLNNGTPFFPYGMIMSGVKPEETRAFRDLADNSFNTFAVWNGATPEKLAEYQTSAAKHGLFVMSCPDECVQGITWECHSKYSGKLLEQVKQVTQNPSLIAMKCVMLLPIPISERNAIYGEFYDKNIDRCLRGVELTKDFPNLTSYFILDEPMAAQQFDEYKFGQDYYARIQRADGYHPVVVNYSSFIPEGDEYVNWCDILVTDPYWSPPASENTRSTPNHVSKICWTTGQRALAHRQAVWQILAAPLWSGCRKRPLNDAELRCQTYLALIHKATGIFFFCYSSARPSNWPTFSQLGVEMKTLGPFAVGLDVAPAPQYRKGLVTAPDDKPQFMDDPFEPQKEQYPAVQAAILADAGGNQMLLAANSRHYPVACRFVIPGLASATCEFGGGKPTLADGLFADTLEPYGTRAYRITRNAAAAALSLTVLQTIRSGDLPNPETALPFACRQDRKNLLPNPSFEEEHTATWPDYCRISLCFSVVTGYALYGRKCLKFENTGARRYEGMQMQCAPQSDKPLTHTFSLYMKGSRDKAKAWIRGLRLNPEKPYGENRTIELTTSWQRHSITGVIPPKVPDDGDTFFEVRLMDPGIMWIDGLQLERGGEPTEFEE